MWLTIGSSAYSKLEWIRVNEAISLDLLLMNELTFPVAQLLKEGTKWNQMSEGSPEFCFHSIM